MSVDSNSIRVGLDISNNWVDVCLLEGEGRQQWRVERDAESLAELTKQLLAKGVTQVVLEASGGLERLVVEVLHAAGIGCAVINPRRVRDFAKATGLLAKTDRLDAYVLALYGRQIEPPVRPPAEPQRRLLLDLLLRLQQLVKMRAGERNRLRRAQQKACEASCVRVIEWLSEEIELLESQIASLVQQCEAWQDREKLLRSAPGVGTKTVWSLLAQLPELGLLDNKPIASLAGLAPFARDSGQYRGQRRISGGRRLVRQMLYMAARTAIRCDLGWRSFYNRLLARGKPPKVALIAVARKLLVALNAMLRDQQPWCSPLSPESSAPLSA